MELNDHHSISVVVEIVVEIIINDAPEGCYQFRGVCGGLGGESPAPPAFSGSLRDKREHPFVTGKLLATYRGNAL